MIGVNGLSGNGYGPWRILAGCQAATHNSTRAAIGRGHGYSTRMPCICPRALDVLEIYQARRAELKEIERAMKRRPKEEHRARLQLPAPRPAQSRSPNFIDGLCAKPGGIGIADLGMNDQASHKGIAERQAAKDLCAACPMLQQCRMWVTTEERPAGSWGGVWGGMDPWNRKGLELVIRKGKARVVPYVGT